MVSMAPDGPKVAEGPAKIRDRTLEVRVLLEDGRRLSKDGISLLEEAVKRFDKAYDENPRCGLALVLKAKVLEKLGRHEDVAECEAKFRRIVPLTPQEMCWMGDALKEALVPREALRYYEDAVRMDPSFIEAWRGKKEAHLMLGESVEAEKCIAEIRRILDMERMAKGAK